MLQKTHLRRHAQPSAGDSAPHTRRHHTSRRRPPRRRLRRVLLLITLLAIIGLGISPWLWQSWVEWRYQPTTYTLADYIEQSTTGENLPTALADTSPRVAIVFGARVYRNGRLSAMLRDRVDTAIALYQAGQVDTLLLSGGQPSGSYDEPGAMRDYAISQGIPAAALQPDYGGQRTYDTCYRAQHIFQVEQAILVTQAFHLPRALLLCDALGLNVVGVEADQRIYDPRSMAWSETREVPALLAALVDLLRQAPPPILGDPMPLD